MRIYVGTYKKYNEGSIFGEWVQIDKYTLKGFYKKCAEIHSDEKDPEFMFQDHEGIPSQLISESWIDERLFDIFDLCLSKDKQESFIKYMENQSFYWDDIQEAFESFTYAYIGNYNSLEDFTDELFDEIELPLIPPHLVYCIDYKAYYHTMKHDYFILENGDVYSNS